MVRAEGHIDTQHGTRRGQDHRRFSRIHDGQDWIQRLTDLPGEQGAVASTAKAQTVVTPSDQARVYIEPPISDLRLPGLLSADQPTSRSPIHQVDRVSAEDGHTTRRCDRTAWASGRDATRSARGEWPTGLEGFCCVEGKVSVVILRVSTQVSAFFGLLFAFLLKSNNQGGRQYGRQNGFEIL